MNKSESQQVAELYVELNNVSRDYPHGISIAALCASIASKISFGILNSLQGHDEEKISVLTDDILQEIDDKIRASVLNTVRDVIKLKHGVH